MSKLLSSRSALLGAGVLAAFALLFAYFIAEAKSWHPISVIATAVIASIATIVLSKIADRALGPRFMMEIPQTNSEDQRKVHEVTFINKRDGGRYESWLRGTISHNGLFYAQECEVFLRKITYLGNDEKQLREIEEIDYADNLPMKWSARGGGKTTLDLLPGIEYCFDFLCVKRGHGDPIIEIRSLSLPPRYDGAIERRGYYAVSFIIGARNAQPAQFECKFYWMEKKMEDGRVNDVLRWVRGSLVKER